MSSADALLLWSVKLVVIYIIIIISNINATSNIEQLDTERAILKII
jgi:hypothetical protein